MNNNESPKTDGSDKPTESVKKCPYKKWIPIFALLLSLIAIGIALAVGRCLWKEIQQLKSNNVILENVVQKMQQELPTLESTVKSQENSISEILNQTKASRAHWAYAEIAYLTQQAIYQLRLSNVDNAVGLLNDALGIFDVSLPNNSPIENKLATTISTLKATPKIDRNALISQIDQLAQQVDTLPLNLPGSPNLSTASSVKNTTSGSWNFFKASWEQLKQLIVIRYHEKPTEPLITPQQDIYLKQNIQLQLEKASMAVLYRDATLYRSSLQKVNTWVKQFFNLRANSTQAFLKATDALSQINIAPTTPDVVTTLQGILNEVKPLLETTRENVATEDSAPVKAKMSKKPSKIHGGSK